MTTSSEHIFQPLIAAHDFISSRLLHFFDNDNFTDAEIVGNEFDVFAIFIATIAFLKNKEPTASIGAVVEDFHATMIDAIAQRILAAQSEEVTAEKENTLAVMIKKIFEERFRHYFHIYKKGNGEDVQHMYTCLADAFLEKAVNEPCPPETLSHFTSFIGELFRETVVILEKTEPLAGS